MANIERFTLPASNYEIENTGVTPGLRISIRSTTSSMPDYHEWRLEEINRPNQENVVTDGACS